MIEIFSIAKFLARNTCRAVVLNNCLHFHATEEVEPCRIPPCAAPIYSGPWHQIDASTEFDLNPMNLSFILNTRISTFFGWCCKKITHERSSPESRRLPTLLLIGLLTTRRNVSQPAFSRLLPRIRAYFKLLPLASNAHDPPAITCLRVTPLPRPGFARLSKQR